MLVVDEVRDREPHWVLRSHPQLRQTGIQRENAVSSLFDVVFWLAIVSARLFVMGVLFEGLLHLRRELGVLVSDLLGLGFIHTREIAEQDREKQVHHYKLTEHDQAHEVEDAAHAERVGPPAAFPLAEDFRSACSERIAAFVVARESEDAADADPRGSSTQTSEPKDLRPPHA